MKREVEIGGNKIGEEHPTILLPEIGVLFKQDINQAKDSIQKVQAAGCSIIKGECYHDIDIVADDGFEYEYKTHLGTRKVNYRAFVQETILPLKVWGKLFGLCHDLGMATIVSAYDKVAIDFLRDIGSSCIKLASPSVVHIPLLKYAAKSGLAVMLDTGKANIEEIIVAVDTLRDSGCTELIVNHTPDGHPCPAEDHNLRLIETYRRLFDCPIGLSDHFAGSEIMLAASALGYDIIEKPVVPNPQEADWGSLWTMPVSEVASVRQQIELCSIARGKTSKNLRFNESSHQARMGLLAKKTLKAGEQISEQTVKFAYPNSGISVKHWNMVEGATLLIDMEENQTIGWRDISIDTTS